MKKREHKHRWKPFTVHKAKCSDCKYTCPQKYPKWRPDNLCATCEHPKDCHLDESDRGWCTKPAGTCIFNPCTCTAFVGRWGIWITALNKWTFDPTRWTIEHGDVEFTGTREDAEREAAAANERMKNVRVGPSTLYVAKERPAP